MKRFLTPNSAAATTKRAADKLESVPKKSRSQTREQQPAVTSLVHNGWTDLGQQALVGYWPRKLSGRSQAVMAALLNDVQWQQVRSLADYCAVAALMEWCALCLSAGIALN